MMVNLNLPIWFCIFITLLLGLLVGVINGLAFTKLHISSLIATLAVQYILRGTGFLITNAKGIYNLPLGYKFLGQGYLFNIFPFPLLMMFIVFAFGIWILNYTYLGRHIYAVGGNVEAARLSGIKTTKIYMYVFAASGLSAAFAGVLMAARMGSGQASIGADFPMDVITAIVLGGVNINGGSGRIIGVLLGAFIMGILTNGMIMLNLNDYVQWLVKGIVLIFAVAMSNIYGYSGEA
jgi:ribose transport system permease protein